MGFARRNLTTMLVAMVTAAVTAGGPALADGVRHAMFAHNADKVDGKHAVGAGATNAQRTGKLVATDANGRLPDNIILKAPDANRLDGTDSTGFLRAKAKAADADALDGKDSSAFVATNDGRLSDAREPLADSVTSVAVADGSLTAADVATLRHQVTLDFISINAQSCQQAWISDYRARSGDIIITAIPDNLHMSLYSPVMRLTTSNDLIQFKLCNMSSSSVNPPSAVFDVTLLRP